MEGERLIYISDTHQVNGTEKFDRRIGGAKFDRKPARSGGIPVIWQICSLLRDSGLEIDAGRLYGSGLAIAYITNGGPRGHLPVCRAIGRLA